jgi:hypothetical protein
MLFALKSVFEPSVWSCDSSMTRVQPAPGCLHAATGCARDGHAATWTRFGELSALPGAEPTTYSTKGIFHEHGNLDLSAESAKLGKPPSPAMSQTRGGAFVVVRARESRAQGEGRQ